MIGYTSLQELENIFSDYQKTGNAFFLIISSNFTVHSQHVNSDRVRLKQDFTGAVIFWDSLGAGDGDGLELPFYPNVKTDNKGVSMSILRLSKQTIFNIDINV